MTKCDVDDLFQLLAFYFAGHQKLRMKGLKAAWLAVLKPYSREDVKAALMSFLREKPGFPTPQEVAIRCPALPAYRTSPEGATKPQPFYGLDTRAKEAQDRLFARMKAERDRLIPLRKAAGLPATMEEAKVAGMTSGTWWNALEAAGLNYPGHIFAKG
jgi:hypothetical protein